MKKYIKGLLTLSLILWIGSPLQAQIPASGLAAWFRADTLVTQTAGAITSLGNANGSGNAAISTDNIGGPTLTNLNGRPSMSFDGTRRLRMPNTVFRNGNTPYTVFVYAQASQVNLSNQPLLSAGVAVNGRYNGFNIIPSGAVQNYWWGGGNNDLISGQNVVSANQPTLFAFTYSTTAGREIRINRAASVSNSFATRNGDSTNQFLGFAQPTSYFSGSISEVVVYDRALSATEVTQVENYLANKYTPTTVLPTGLSAWYRADTLVSVSAGAVTQWGDASGQGRNAVQATGVRQPVAIGSAVNGRPAIRFDGTNDRLVIASGVLPLGNNPYTFFAIARTTNANTNGGIMGGGSTSPSLSYNSFRLNQGGSFINDWGQNAAVTPANTIQNNRVYLYQVDYNTTTGRTIRINNVVSGSNAGITRTGAAGDVALGSSTLATDNESWAGDIAEVIVFNRALSSAEITQVQNVLSQKYSYLSSVRDASKPATKFALDQNYPNPFNPSTSIGYQVSGVSDVKLEVFDMLGRKVATLVNERQAAGSYSSMFNAGRLASGMYFYRLEVRSSGSQVGTLTETKKMLLVK
jgi:hypothetical protein